MEKVEIRPNTASTMSSSRKPFTPRRAVLNSVLPLIFLFLLAAPLRSADIWWTGDGADNNWSTDANWSGGAAPGAGDTVLLGFADDGEVDNVAQNIVLDVDTTILQFDFRAEGNRAVSLTSPDNHTINLALDASSQANPLGWFRNGDATVFIDVNFHKSGTGSRGWFRNFNTQLVTFGPAFTYTTNTGSFENSGGGPLRFEGEIASNWRSRSAFTMTIAGGSFGATSFDSAPTMLMAGDGDFSSFTPASSGQMDVTISGSGNRRLEIRTLGIRTSSNVPDDDMAANSPINLDANGSGELTLAIGYVRLLGARIVTDADTTVEIISHPTAGNREMQFGGTSDDAGVSGAGNLLLNMDAPGHVFTLNRRNSYTGRTMLEQGILFIGSHNVTGDQRTGSGTFGNETDTPVYQPNLPYGFELGTYYGALPETTIVEIGENAILRLNPGTGQTLGGVTGLNGTVGGVELNNSTLTIHSTSATSFDGTISGTGGLVKSGAETFTLENGYTSEAGGLLRVEDGTFEVLSGGLTLEDTSVFQPSGGLTIADNLLSTGVTWNLTLTEGTEGLRLVEVQDATFTGTNTLGVSLANGYDPDEQTKFTLLYAENEIAGFSASNMFGFSDGALLRIGSTQGGDPLWAIISWEIGSESILLTVVPEPGSVLLLLLAGAGLMLPRRRRKA